MIIYESTIGKLNTEFNIDPLRVINDIEKNIKEKLGRATSAGEWKSWGTTLKTFIEHLNSEEKMRDLNVLLEYTIPWMNSRIDVVIAGKKNGNKHLFAIELKGWTVASVNNKTKNINANTTYPVSHPSEQIKGYKKDLLNLTNINTELKYNLEPVVVLPNYDKDEKYKLWDAIFNYENDSVKKYDSRNIKNLVTLISDNVNEALERFELKELDNLKRKPINPLLALDSMDQIVLSSSQQRVVDKIINYSKLNEKQVIIVKGDPGCGKTVVGINLLIEFAKLGITSDLIAPGEEFRSALKHKWKEVAWEGNIRGFEIKEEWYKNMKTDVWLFDEAHKLTKMGMKIHWFIKTALKHSNMLVAFIDDYQLVTKDGCTSHEYIDFCIQNEIKYQVLELNESFRNAGDISYPNWIKRWLYNWKYTIDNFTFEQVKFMNNIYKVNIFDDEVKFADSYIEEYSKHQTRMLTMWFKHPDFVVKFDENGLPEKNIKIGNHYFSWNVNKMWLRRLKEKHRIKNIPKQSEALALKSFNSLEGKGKEFIGYYHNVQGAEFEKTFVYIPSFIKYDLNKKEVIFDITDLFNSENIKSIVDGTGLLYAKKKLNEYIPKNIQFLKNRLYILLTRATKETNIYCEDKNLGIYLKSIVKD